MNNYAERTGKILERIYALAAISEEPGSVTRIFGTEAFIAGRNQVVEWMAEAGLEVRIDSIGNVRGRLVSGNAEGKTLVIASHIDTVRNAGMFDGILGVVMGIDLAANMNEMKIALPFHLELVAFSDEEGVRFHSTFLGSKVVAGSFDRALLAKKDEAGISLEDAITFIGGNISNIESDAIEKTAWLGYFEIHIEQGPVLYEKHLPAALVSAIAGQKRVEIRFSGMAGHAGTVPVYMRRDALCCAAEFILETESLAITHSGNIVATVGKLNVPNSASNVIPGEVVCSLDIRGDDLALLNESYAALKESCERICKNRSINNNWNLVQETAPVLCDETLNGLLSASMEAVTGTSMRLVSGAGHDAVPVSVVAPVCMLFVRCFEGISHHPLENVEPKDIAKSLEISELFLNLLIKKYNQS